MRRAIKLGPFSTAMDYMCFYLDIFVCHQNAIAKERNYARRWIIIVACENRRRYKGSKMTSCCAMMTQRNDPDNYYTCRPIVDLRDAYFENDVGQISARWRSRVRRQYKSALDIPVLTWFSNTDLCRAQATIIHMIRCHLGAAIFVW